MFDFFKVTPLQIADCLENKKDLFRTCYHNYLFIWTDENGKKLGVD